MAVSVQPVVVRTYAVRPVVCKPVVVDNYKDSQIPAEDFIFLVAENILNKIVNIRLPLHLGA